MTALHWACNKGQLDAVKLLIEYLAFPNHMEFTEDRWVGHFTRRDLNDFLTHEVVFKIMLYRVLMM